MHKKGMTNEAIAKFVMKYRFDVFSNTLREVYPDAYQGSCVTPKMFKC